ncbi:hypothetical protein GGTG_14296 [Gaeumannomyces tritici R3-111a-1]|uniref:Uncharacterized protein n=1 Tax=Gaeumannomyces tritici (strain R3-111a-1) TaxID=644352 RepID=J3PL51_GAET3|nr:hypothetical protein GGTG_14296 [Gaeumannomyces tritici R3-111a-1]EJT68124.1 hypothetical protein GGTG_14296 [Gaeumannomyces tritici R3-111a-1]
MAASFRALATLPPFNYFPRLSKHPRTRPPNPQTRHGSRRLPPRPRALADQLLSTSRRQQRTPAIVIEESDSEG